MSVSLFCGPGETIAKPDTIGGSPGFGLSPGWLPTSLVCGLGDGVRDLQCLGGEEDLESSEGLRGLGDGVRDLGRTLGIWGGSGGWGVLGGLGLFSTGIWGGSGGCGVRLADRRLVGICIGFPRLA